MGFSSPLEERRCWLSLFPALSCLLPCLAHRALQFPLIKPPAQRQVGFTNLTALARTLRSRVGHSKDHRRWDITTKSRGHDVFPCAAPHPGLG